ncbi:MAG: hypothetical protein ACI81V_000094 [Lentimonas sp.]|jgi:hypothetical protein
MKKITILLVLIYASGGLSYLGAAYKINLSSPKGTVLADPQREVVITMARYYLGDRDPEFLTGLKGSNNPFLFVQPVEVAQATSTEQPKVVAEVRASVVYDDASVLQAVLASFSKQVRGMITRGSQNYIQLDSGRLIEAGATFPARIPDADNQTFTVVVDSIDAAKYRLRIGDSTATHYFNELSSKAMGITRYTQE